MALYAPGGLAFGKADAKRLKLLLSARADVIAQGGKYGSALQAPLEGGYEEIVNLLLSKGADGKSQDGHEGSTLQASSASYDPVELNQPSLEMVLS